MLTLSKRTHNLIAKEHLKAPRHYHTYAHVCDVLDTIHEHSDKFSNLQAAELAAYFHDIVYEVGDDYDYNEQRSCLRFLEVIESENPMLSYMNFGDADFDTMHLALVMIGCTKGHTLDNIRDPSKLSESQREDVKMFLDADLRILSRDQKRLLEFEDGIRKEFSIYDDEVYRNGRIRVLQSFLNRRKLYFSEIGKTWEDTARENLQFLINRLKDQK